ncbi:MAG: hypothetical protein KatS3mg056_3614 [Chloroflexus sp.]|nr:MAG: hypothetical protein KatS3mg056_3614 [Chloroflexus sp.]
MMGNDKEPYQGIDWGKPARLISFRVDDDRYLQVPYQYNIGITLTTTSSLVLI